MKKVLEGIVVTFLFLLICLIYKDQPRISLNQGQGWDGVYYYHMSEQILQGIHPIREEQPFVSRPGTPYLIAICSRMTGFNLLDASLVVNLLGMYLTILLLLFWLGRFFRESRLKLLLCGLMMLGWYLPLRSSFYDVMATDAWGAVWFMAGILMLPVIRKQYENRRYWKLGLFLLVFSTIVGVGGLFRESNIVLFPALFFIVNPLKSFENLSFKAFSISAWLKSFRELLKRYGNPAILLFSIPLVFILASKIFLAGSIQAEPGDYSYLKTLFKWFYSKSLPGLMLGVFHACGPLVVLLPFYHKEIRSLLWQKQELLFLLLVAFLFGYVGGSDTERIFFMSAFPVLLIWMGFSIKRIFTSSKRWWLFLLFALQAVAFRIFWNLPDYPSDNWSIPFPFFGFFGDHFQSLFLFSQHGQYILNSLLFLEYILLFVVTGIILTAKPAKAK